MPIRPPLTLALAGLVLFFCGACSKPEQAPPQKSPEELAAEKKALALQKREAERKKFIIQPVDPARLAELLPAPSAELTRTEPAKTIEEFEGLKTSKIQASYTKDGKQFDLQIWDFAEKKGRIPQHYWWVDRNVDQTLKVGYEKTSYVQQWYRGYEKADKEKDLDECYAYVGERFIVYLKGKSGTIELLKENLGKIDLKKLATMK